MRFRQKFAVNDNGLRADQVLNAGDATPRLLVDGLDHFNGALAVNPKIIKRSDPGLKPEAHPFVAKRPSLIDDWSPVVCHQHDVGHLPLSQLASMPKPSSIRRFYGANEVRNIQEFQIFTDHSVVLFPVQEKAVADVFCMVRIRRRLTQKGIPMIRRIAEWARHWSFAISQRQMSKDTARVGGTVAPAYGHRLFASGATSTKCGIRTELAPKLRCCELFRAVRVKGIFHGEFPWVAYRFSLKCLLGDAWPAQWLRERGQFDAAQAWEGY
ncbi:MAG: hypothetical protein AB7S53_02430 [Thiomonas sp.]